MQLLAKSTLPFRQVLQGAISRRAAESGSKSQVLPGINRPTLVTKGDVEMPIVPVLVAPAPTPDKLPVPILAVPQASSPLTAIGSIVETARRNALLRAYAEEIQSYPDTPL